ncbi:MAG TPA: GWxTD domain-containing protein [Thermoanaerobaculia bacterium]|jgi:GWxTD domain-containing protein
MKRFAPLFFGVSILAASAFAGDPVQAPTDAITEARAAIAAADNNRAVNVLHAASFEAVKLPEPQRTSALAAIHFYGALAYSNLGVDARAAEELRNFFKLQPDVKAIDPAKYPEEFVAVFNEVRGSTGKRSDRVQANAGPGEPFDRVYPAAKLFNDVVRMGFTIAQWHNSPEYQFVATEVEKKAWKALSTDGARKTFIADFWSRRDPSPGTPENEMRDEFERRAAFADVAFAPNEERFRGSVSDRARVYLLLGRPARVYVEPLNRARGAFLPSRYRDALSGTVERWVYHKSQLPKSIPTDFVAFRFIDEPGYGDFVLQREFYVLKALNDAKEVPAQTASSETR